jgi:hypothetical protein
LRPRCGNRRRAGELGSTDRTDTGHLRAAGDSAPAPSHSKPPGPPVGARGRLPRSALTEASRPSAGRGVDESTP